MPWFAALPIGVFVIGPLMIRLFEVPAASQVQVATFVGLIVVGLARAVPLPGASVLADAPAENHLDVDRAIELAKRANAGTTADLDYVELKRLCTGRKEIEALLVIAQFGSAKPAVDSGVSRTARGTQESDEGTNTLPVTPCSACGGRGRVEREGARPNVLARLLGTEQVVEKCPECNGTGAAEVS